jgi:type II secretory ATPase GspE/PulE/Tfp pilus assembly ATPase PilB-like protein
MTCEEVRERLVPYAYGELSDDDKAPIEEHLAGCAACSAELESLEKVLSLTQTAYDESVVQRVNTVLQAAIRRSASDLHIEKSDGQPRVRLRVDGVLQEGPALTLEMYEPVIARIKLMAEMNLNENRVPQDGRIAIRYEGKDYDFRCSVFPYYYGEGVVMRILDRSSVKVGLNALGFLPDTLTKIESLISLPQGLFIATGPTGSGKTTFLYSALQKLNQPQWKIMTIEDPVEYVLTGVNHGAVNVKAGLNFANGVRALLRQDPDILMVGETRDPETAELCCQAAVSGHGVFTTLHTQDTPEALSRLMDLGIEPFALASSVTGILGQRLARRICGECKEAHSPPESLVASLGFNAENRPEAFYRGKGCEACNGQGYRGRTGLFELLVMNKELARLIRRNRPETEIRERALEMGALYPFHADGRRKVAQGVTTPEEVERVLEGLTVS